MKVANLSHAAAPQAGGRLLLVLLWLMVSGPTFPPPAHAAAPVDRMAAAPSPAAANAPTAQPKPSVRVALYHGSGTGGKGPPSLIQRFKQGTEFSVTEVTPEDIGRGVLTNYDVVIFAGGSGSKQGAAIGEAGREAVRQFVGRGGGYVGICAGAFLATSGFPWSLHIIDAKPVSPKWQRGRGDVKVELTDQGREIIGDRAGEFDVIYHNGPVVQPAKAPSLPPYKPLAFFRSEMASNGAPVGVMINAPAIFAGDYKKGRVVCISPHPEQTPGLEEIVPKVVAWVAPKSGRAVE